MPDEGDASHEDLGENAAELLQLGEDDDGG
jgi:hypothetical protein